MENLENFKGTQLDWELHKNTSWGDGNTKHGHVICMRQNGQLISFAGTWTPYNSMTTEEEAANAHLIAAAPELLNACIAAVKEIENNDIGILLNNAIKKALNI